MVLIAVHGSASRFLPAERGTVRLSLGLEHGDRAAALAAVTRLHEQYVAEAKSFVHKKAATWWGSDQVRVRAERRYVKDSDAYTVIQVASAEVRVKFRGFSALSDWVDTAGSTAGVAVHGVEWAVTEARRTEVQREVRVQAVQDARSRAEAYASAIGSGSVILRALWEPGLRSAGGDDDGGGMSTRAYALSHAPSGIEFRPDDIEISAAVTADFEVG